MYYKIQNTKEAWRLSGIVPEAVLSELVRGAAVLSAEYGDNGSGGYAIVAETKADLETIAMHLFDYRNAVCEWATSIDDSGYISVLYLLNNDYSIMLYMPKAITPKSILQELED